MITYEVYKRLREEQRELAVRIGRLEQFIDDYDNKGMNKELNDDSIDILRDQLDAMKDYNMEQFIDNHDDKGTNEELNDDYMDILRDQWEAMKDYNNCLIHRIGIAVTEGIAPQERSRGNQAILRDVKKFRETDPRDPAKQDSDKVVADEDEHNFGFYCGFDTSIL